MIKEMKQLALVSVLALPVQQAHADEWADYDYGFDKMHDEISTAECYTHKMAMAAEDMLFQRGNDETASPTNMLLRVFGKYARGIYLDQYHALNTLNDVADQSAPPEDVMQKAQGATYLFHEGFLGDARNFAAMVGIDEPAIMKSCTTNPNSYYPDL